MLLVLLDELGAQRAGEKELSPAHEFGDEVREIPHDVGGVKVAVDQPVHDADHEREGTPGRPELEGPVVLSVEPPESILQLGQQRQGPDERAVGAEEGVLVDEILVAAVRRQYDELVDAARPQLQHAFRVARVIEAGLPSLR